MHRSKLPDNVSRTSPLALRERRLGHLRCIDCGRSLGPAAQREAACPACGRRYPIEDGILLAMGELTGKNRIAAAFYNGPRFEKFRFWEKLFLCYAGGLKGARRQILRHLPAAEGDRLLEVGIGDGDNVSLLPEHARLTGIDIALRRLQVCRRRCAWRSLDLVLAEAECIPFADHVFDAVLCVGGLNYFSNPGKALTEMARVTRPGGRIVVADEIPDLLRYGWGHRIHVPALDHWLIECWLGSEFREMVLSNDLDVAELGRAALAESRVHPIWRGYGYCLVGSPPRSEKELAQ